MSAPSAKIPPEERLVNLVVALLATEQGLTKDAVLASVAGYREQGTAGASKDALEKMFERDKENLRALGVPIETIGDWLDPDDLREARYRIPTSEYELPADIDFRPDEIALLNLAAEVWGESSMSDGARGALRKIRALGIAVDAPIVGFAPRINLRDPAFAPMQQAIESARVIAFDYLKPGERAPRRRRIRPLALVDYEARWHVFGWDLDQDAERTFLLSRVMGDAVLTRERFDPTMREGAGARAREGLEQVASRNIALLEVDPGTEAALRLARRALRAEQGIRVPFVDLHVFADELASYGPEVRVVEPDALRDQVVARLIAVRDRHEVAS
ncbi:helix-turn-helix transcriptional regulator [Microbacterium aurantiacum]|uniref:Transcriptional regulator n=1 Tax=Microbacterium aurantiacum TaxID=162393 RepID=A0A0M9VLP4_9MICO|nr:WYL domain-containing protein [Microbacterium chocolatum]ANG86722.1 WYL domain-containing protein [Microbacterium chocolatum]KOS11385.1 transcriptional regulator [Microbacterium chocolatum]